MHTLENSLFNYATHTPQQLAAVCGNTRLNYSELLQHVTQKVPKHEGKSPLVIRATQDIDFLVTYLACHIAKRVIVPLEHDTPNEKFQQISDLISSADIPAEVADILFTTGTTGVSKGTMVSHQAILANAENLAVAQEFSADLCFIICGPLNHIGSLSKIWPTLLKGGTIHILPGIKDLNLFFEAVRTSHYKVGTFLVPASIRILLQLCKKQIEENSNKFDFIETGAAPMPLSDMKLLSSLLPNARLYNTYASTETGIICTYNYNDGDCIPGCLGRPMHNSGIFITEEGKIACKGKTLMTGYVGEPQKTQEVLREGILYTSDIATIDEHGRLQLTGREGDVINIGGYKVSPAEVEDAAMGHPQIKECICISKSSSILGTQLELLYVTLENCLLEKKVLANYLKHRLESYKVPLAYRQVEKIERTFNGKLNRKYYAIK